MTTVTVSDTVKERTVIEIITVERGKNMVRRIAAMLALACLLGGCQAAPKAEDDMQSMPNMEVETNGEYHKITAEEAWEMMAAQMVTVVDVRKGTLQTPFSFPTRRLKRKPRRR